MFLEPIDTPLEWRDYRLVTLWEIMNAIDVGRLGAALASISRWHQCWYAFKAAEINKPPIINVMDVDDFQKLRNELEIIAFESTEHKLAVTLAKMGAIRDLINTLPDAQVPKGL